MRTALAIDTASDAFALAFVRDGEVVSSIQCDAPRDHSRSVLAAIDTLLGESRAEIGLVIVVLGPGSYAGLRVGLAIAQGLAFALRIPVIGIGTLESVARAAGMDPVTAVHPAGRGEYAAQDFAGGIAAGPVRIAIPAEIRGHLIAGERAAELGGYEVAPLARLLAAVALAAERSPRLDASSLDAIYVREPHTTRPKRTPLLATPQE